MNSSLHHIYSSRDEDLLDQEIPAPTLRADILIEVAKIQSAAEQLRSVTSFLGNVQALDERLPVIKTSVNEVIAGSDRTVADLFDFTGKNFSSLGLHFEVLGTQHYTFCLPSSRLGR